MDEEFGCLTLQLQMKESRLDRFRGCLVGLAVGDALGTSVEFKPRGTFAPVRTMLGGGPFGLATVCLLHLMGISPIILSEPVDTKRNLARELGADHVIDPFGGEMGKLVFEMTSGVGFPAVFECAGVPDNIQKALDWVARGGDICVVSMMFAPAPIVPMTLNFKEARLTGCYSNTQEENRQCLQWMAEGRLDGRSLITDVVSLAQLPTVFRERIDTGRAIKVLVETGAEKVSA